MEIPIPLSESESLLQHDMMSVSIQPVLQLAIPSSESVILSTFQQISYRSNWFNLMIYGNCVHIVGYMIVTAWVSSIVTKCGAKTGEKRAGSKVLTTD